MRAPRPDLETIRAALEPHGLFLRGAVNFTEGEAAPALADGHSAASVVLVGNVGSSLWPAFVRWRGERPDRGGSDPLDAWSKEVIGAVAAATGATAWFPSDPPWQPFQQWAMRAEALKASPLGILIHPLYGLWHGYRGALGFSGPAAAEQPSAAQHPCDRCPDKPCLATCPAGAVRAGAFDVPACRTHLRSPEGQAGCMGMGCLARAACPVGAAYRYDDAQLCFHMARSRFDLSVDSPLNSPHCQPSRWVMRVLFFFSFLPAVFLLRSVAMAEPAKCTEIEHLSGRYTVCVFDPAKDRIHLYGAATLGEGGATYDRLNTHLLRNGQYMSFAMNGGMYHADYGPVGLLVERGRKTGALNRGDAFGNFFMKPNGVFWVGHGEAGVIETEAFAHAGLSPREATQSGPMLVIDGAIHPRFLPDATSLQIRNGVGMLPDGRVAFAISNDPVRFHDFATLFRDRLHAANALFLDGSISSLYAPEIRRHDRDAVMGTVIAVVKDLPR